MMPGMDGLTFLRKIKEVQAAVEVIMLTARQEMTLLDRALKLKAFDYLVMPAPLQKLVAAIRAAMTCRLQKLGTPMVPAPMGTVVEGWFVAGPESARLAAWAKACAPYCATALIQGPPGAGGTHLARVLHAASGRPENKLVHVDVSMLTPAQQEPELLRGLLHWKKVDSSIGALKRADGGTLLLENIEQLSPSLQRRLVTLLDTGQLDDPPSMDEDFLDVKIVALTHHDLEAAAARDEMSPDLMRKLTLVSVTIPPLAARPAEIAPLARHFVIEAGKAAGKTLTGLAAAAERVVAGYPWKRDVAQLHETIQQAARNAAGPLLGLADLPEDIRTFGRDDGFAAADDFLKS
jgi:DNA-binding NtrC family response regulator